ncbi:hypothetical protein BDA99DRAFT_554474 [Phascolomyces articulosus]|uniref:Uncharacterized protein n=1 Tax=Phascolomyces articulosus TaxID=60185 RepID=A0AAD5KCP1_9FUNG|nr:hypothetical protein BDA99DRAFT_554474 [Phascolomyces articulosus]
MFYLTAIWTMTKKQEQEEQAESQPNHYSIHSQNNGTNSGDPTTPAAAYIMSCSNSITLQSFYQSTQDSTNAWAKASNTKKEFKGAFKMIDISPSCSTHYLCSGALCSNQGYQE